VLHRQNEHKFHMLLEQLQADGSVTNVPSFVLFLASTCESLSRLRGSRPTSSSARNTTRRRRVAPRGPQGSSAPSAGTQEVFALRDSLAIGHAQRLKKGRLSLGERARQCLLGGSLSDDLFAQYWDGEVHC
jgi:hypothetical protein